MAANTIFGPNTLNANSGTDPRSLRIWRQLTANSQGAISVTFEGPPSGNFLAGTHASFGKRNSSANYDTTATPIELKFSGASGFGPTQGTIASDFMDHSSIGALNSGDFIVVILDVMNASSANRQFRYNGGGSTTWTAIYNNQQTWNDPVPSTSGAALDEEGEYNFAIQLIQSDVVGGGSSPKVISGLHHIEEGSPMGKRTNGLLHPIGKGWVGWRKKLIRVTHTIKRAA